MAFLKFLKFSSFYPKLLKDKFNYKDSKFLGRFLKALSIKFLKISSSSPKSFSYKINVNFSKLEGKCLILSTK